jgi:hypothetical protein
VPATLLQVPPKTGDNGTIFPDNGIIFPDNGTIFPDNNLPFEARPSVE